MNLLLLSNSTILGHPYLEWPRDLIDRFLHNVRNVAFVPYAAVSFGYDKYEEMVAQSMKEVGIKVTSIHRHASPKQAIEEAEAIFVGGGNTFHLLHQLYALDLMDAIRTRVKDGAPYVGWSAGSNVACPSVKTTNDMPIIEPPSFDALNLVRFQVNPHYTERTIDGHGGESREQRLMEYAAINEVPVVCLPEGCAIRIQDGQMRLLSAEPVKLISKGGEVTSLHHGDIVI